MKFLKTTVLTAIKVVAAVAAAIQVLRGKDTSEYPLLPPCGLLYPDLGTTVP